MRINLLKATLLSFIASSFLSSCKNQGGTSNLEAAVKEEGALKLNKVDSELFIEAIAKSVEEYRARQAEGEPEPFDTKEDFSVTNIKVSEPLAGGRGSIYFRFGDIQQLLEVEPRSKEGSNMKRIILKLYKEDPINADVDVTDWANSSINAHCIRAICTISRSQTGGAPRPGIF